jgi:diacylglycerol kinase (ATP)
MIEAAARARGLQTLIRITERAGHARELARDAVGANAAAVIVWGGDGTINESGAALIGSPTVLGVVPAGSGNGLAAALGVSRDPATAIADAFDAPAHRIDAGLMDGRPFFNIAGIGFDARVAALFNARAAGSRGGWPYIAIGVREGCRYGAVDYVVTLDAESTRTRHPARGSTTACWTRSWSRTRATSLRASGMRDISRPGRPSERRW